MPLPIIGSDAATAVRDLYASAETPAQVKFWESIDRMVANDMTLANTYRPLNK